MDLPVDLRLALTNELANIPQKSIATAAERLSIRYRGGQLPVDGTFLYSPADVTAYAAYRLPSTFAAIYAACNERRKRNPAWQPRTMLDIGAGPGTALWAASAVWPTVEHATLLERDDDMLAIGKRHSCTRPLCHCT